MDFNVKVVLDSIAPNGARLTTLEVTMPRFLLAQWNTHRSMSRNAASSRAVPTTKMLERVEQQPFVPFETFGDPATLNCDRDSQGDVWFADMGVSVVWPHCLERLEEGLLPQKWMGRRIAPIESWGGCDVDYEWQIPLVERWLLEHGVEPAPEAKATA